MLEIASTSFTAQAGIAARTEQPVASTVLSSEQPAVLVEKDHPTVVIQKVDQENPAMAVLFDKLAVTMNECAALTQSNTDNATIAGCFRKVANALNDAANQVDNL
jgi:hypothetical protein